MWSGGKPYCLPAWPGSSRGRRGRLGINYFRLFFPWIPPSPLTLKQNRGGANGFPERLRSGILSSRVSFFVFVFVFFFPQDFLRKAACEEVLNDPGCLRIFTQKMLGAGWEAAVSGIRARSPHSPWRSPVSLRFWRWRLWGKTWALGSRRGQRTDPSVGAQRFTRSASQANDTHWKPGDSRPTPLDSDGEEKPQEPLRIRARFKIPGSRWRTTALRKGLALAVRNSVQVRFQRRSWRQLTVTW